MVNKKSLHCSCENEERDFTIKVSDCTGRVTGTRRGREKGFNFIRVRNNKFSVEKVSRKHL